MVKIKIGEVEYTEEEARQIYNHLHKYFGGPTYYPVPVTYPVYPCVPCVPNPWIGDPVWTSTPVIGATTTTTLEVKC